MLKKAALFLTQRGIIILIVSLASWLRVTELDSKAIFFGDAGRDLLVASQAVADRQLPLLGIPSSLPRFSQGPLTIWLEMAIFLLAGYSLFPYSLVFALISILAVIAIYEVVVVFGSKQQALLAAALLAGSPLAVAHGRMVYHTNPIPLATILFIWSLIRLHQGKSRSWFWSILAWCFVFQFELALLPLLLMIPIIIWRQKQKISRQNLLEAGLAFSIGLAPQILYDLTHGFTQLGGFAVWVGYRLVSAVSIVGDHALGPSSLLQTLVQLKLYGLRIVSLDQAGVGVIFIAILVFSAGKSWQLWRRQQLPILMELGWLASGLLSLGFLVHSSPSEAYFPVFCVFLPLLTSFGLVNLGKKFEFFGWGAVGVWLLFMTISISRHGWFVDQNTGFAYGPSVSELRQTVMISRLVTNDNFRFKTLQPGGNFPSYFDNLRWLAKESGVTESLTGIPVFIEPKNSTLNSYPTAAKIELSTQDIYLYE